MRDYRRKYTQVNNDFDWPNNDPRWIKTYANKSYRRGNKSQFKQFVEQETLEQEYLDRYLETLQAELDDPESF